MAYPVSLPSSCPAEVVVGCQSLGGTRIVGAAAAGTGYLMFGETVNILVALGTDFLRFNRPRTLVVVLLASFCFITPSRRSEPNR